MNNLKSNNYQQNIMKDNSNDNLQKIIFFTVILPILIWIIVILSNSIMKIFIPNYKDENIPYEQRLFYLYIHLILIIITISIIRVKFHPKADQHFFAALFLVTGPVIYFAGDFPPYLKNVK